MLAFSHCEQEYTLRPLHQHDAPLLLELIEADRAHLRQWLEWIDRFGEPDDARRFIRQAEEDMENQKRLVLAICLQNELLGLVEMHNWDKDLKMAEIGYWLKKAAEGKGIMFAALRAFIDYLFQNLLLNRIGILHAAGNGRSAALAQRLHFKPEGVLREAMRVQGQLQDKVIQALLRKEWEARRFDGA